jgi:hypothetical protein
VMQWRRMTGRRDDRTIRDRHGAIPGTPRLC